MTIGDWVPWVGKRRATNPEGEQESSFVALQRQVNSLFEDFFRGFPNHQLFGLSGRLTGFSPKVDVRDEGAQILVRAELPGIEEKDVELTLTKDALTIRGEKRSSSEHGDHYSECTYGAFQRIIPLSAEIDEDRVEATFRNGVLSINIPKAPAEIQRTKKVEIRSGE